MPAEKKPASAEETESRIDEDAGSEEGEEEAAAQDQAKEGDKPQQDATSSFFIVGIGASAGGLEALTALLSNIKLDCMAFVVVQHLAPKHESFLPALLSRTSNIKVLPAADGTQVEPNKVYVIPPNSDLAILQGVLHVMTPPRAMTPHGPHLP